MVFISFLFEILFWNPESYSHVRKSDNFNIRPTNRRSNHLTGIADARLNTALCSSFPRIRAIFRTFFVSAVVIIIFLLFLVSHRINNTRSTPPVLTAEVLCGITH